MLHEILLGGGFAFAAVLQPGPLQAFLLTRAAAHGWKRTLPAALSPLLSDGPIALIALLAVGRLPLAAQRGLRAAGGLVLLYFAWAALRHWRSGAETSPAGGRVPGTLLQAALVNVLNPNPYLGWTMVLGPAAAGAWQQAPARAVALVAAFYVVMVAGLAGVIVLAGTTHHLGVRRHRLLVLISALLLAGLGVYQLAVSLLDIRTG